MKYVAIGALVLALGGVAVAAYHLIETYPRVRYYENKSKSPSRNRRYSSRLDRLERLVEMSVRDAAFNQVYAMWGLGGLALILGVAGAIKSELKKLSIAASVLAVGVLVVSLTTIMLNRLG